VLRIIVFHELETDWPRSPLGTMYGTEAVSEQYLRRRPWTLWCPVRYWWEIVISEYFDCLAAHQRGLQVVVRLTAERALKLAGGPITEEGERR